MCVAAVSIMAAPLRRKLTWRKTEMLVRQMKQLITDAWSWKFDNRKYKKILDFFLKNVLLPWWCERPVFRRITPLASKGGKAPQSRSRWSSWELRKVFNKFKKAWILTCLSFPNLRLRPAPAETKWRQRGLRWCRPTLAQSPPGRWPELYCFKRDTKI